MFLRQYQLDRLEGTIESLMGTSNVSITDFGMGVEAEVCRRNSPFRSRREVRWEESALPGAYPAPGLVFEGNRRLAVQPLGTEEDIFGEHEPAEDLVRAPVPASFVQGLLGLASEYGLNSDFGRLVQVSFTIPRLAGWWSDGRPIRLGTTWRQEHSHVGSYPVWFGLVPDGEEARGLALGTYAEVPGHQLILGAYGLSSLEVVDFEGGEVDEAERVARFFTVPERTVKFSWNTP